jgi:hypothetical protein
MTGSSSWTVERREQIAAPPATVVERIVDFRRWSEWSPWEDIDPDLQRTFSGAESGVGAVYEWEGNRKAGKGRMEIIRVDGDREVEIDLQFLKPFKSHNSSVFHIDPDGEGSVVTWIMTGPKTLMTRIMGIFSSMDKMIGPDFEKGLSQLNAATRSG